MGVYITENSDTSEFKEGDEAGLKSPEATKSGQASVEFVEAVKDAKKAPVNKRSVEESAVPLFLRGSSDGPKGNDQDEKDGASE